MMAFQRPEVGDYILGQELGAGSIAKVKLGTHKTTGATTAVKIVKKNIFEAKPGLEKKVRRDISLMRLIDHPHILKLVDLYESRTHLYLILEYASHGELFEFLLSRISRRETGFLSNLLFRSSAKSSTALIICIPGRSATAISNQKTSSWTNSIASKLRISALPAG
jgi:serine/threonine protein kinase